MMNRGAHMRLYGSVDSYWKHHVSVAQGLHQGMHGLESQNYRNIKVGKDLQDHPVQPLTKHCYATKPCHKCLLVC